MLKHIRTQQKSEGSYHPFVIPFPTCVVSFHAHHLKLRITDPRLGLISYVFLNSKVHTGTFHSLCWIGSEALWVLWRKIHEAKVFFLRGSCNRNFHLECNFHNRQYHKLQQKLFKILLRYDHLGKAVKQSFTLKNGLKGPLTRGIIQYKILASEWQNLPTSWSWAFYHPKLPSNTPSKQMCSYETVVM